MTTPVSLPAEIHFGRGIRNRLLRWKPSEREHRFWCLDARINEKGMRIDRQLAINAVAMFRPTTEWKAIRHTRSVRLEELRQRFGAERAERLRREAARWIAAGTLRISSGRMAVPPEHFLVSDAVIESLFEA